MRTTERPFNATPADKAEDAEAKVNNLERLFKRNRISINGIKVLNHPWLRVYDVITVDLHLPEEGREFGFPQLLSLFRITIHIFLRICYA